jgi:hypothetical protein
MGGLFHCNFCFVVHAACYSMDAIHLNGNVWIDIPLRSGKQVRMVIWHSSVAKLFSVISLES